MIPSNRKGKLKMGKAQELFDQATRSYDKAISIIRAMDETFQDAVFRNNPSQRYDTKVTLAQFDRILQAILLNEALSDGNFDRLEQQFVDKITDYGDLLVYIKRETNGQLDLSWSVISSLDRRTQQQLMDVMPSILDKLCDSFVKPLAVVDKAVDRINFLKQIEDLIAEICICLCKVDGVAQKAEAEAAGEMVGKLLHARWQRYMR